MGFVSILLLKYVMAIIFLLMGPFSTVCSQELGMDRFQTSLISSTPSSAPVQAPSSVGTSYHTPIPAPSVGTSFPNPPIPAPSYFPTPGQAPSVTTPFPTPAQAPLLPTPYPYITPAQAPSPITTFPKPAAPAPSPVTTIPSPITTPPSPGLPLRSHVAVQGVVFCKPCQHKGVDTLHGATPITGLFHKHHNFFILFSL
ncbi:hypothetical protein FRX31_011500 [Thalictrum thalictroides]|uniref:Uncharacterized protein n=1 Tax=Thalictrum thalictroides TaxID=46969 RepID=A0A7J6WPM1_THATH|nr:hypothetical protein FRX31_011500 [Thalictrum thalictroides]